ncbi:WW/Rsp5/WWP [Pyrenophora tritici-repentis]|nr:WW/Rsp5/WWP [Pyrenophora tritici-repentis]
MSFDAYIQRADDYITKQIHKYEQQKRGRRSPPRANGVAIPEARPHKAVNTLNHPPLPWYHTDGPKSSILAVKNGITSTDRRGEVNGTHHPTHRRAHQRFSLMPQCPVHITSTPEKTRTEHGQIRTRNALRLAQVSMDNI